MRRVRADPLDGDAEFFPTPLGVFGGALEDSSFFRAMGKARGTLSVLDRNAVSFTRIWCVFELYKSLADIAGMSQGRQSWPATAIDQES